MIHALLPRASGKPIAIALLSEKTLPGWLKRQPARTKEWLKTHAFKAKPGRFCVVPNASGKTACVVAGLSDPPSLWDLADLSNRLPAGDYHIEWDGPLAYHEC